MRKSDIFQVVSNVSLVAEGEHKDAETQIARADRRKLCHLAFYAATSREKPIAVKKPKRNASGSGRRKWPTKFTSSPRIHHLLKVVEPQVCAWITITESSGRVVVVFVEAGELREICSALGGPQPVEC